MTRNDIRKKAKFLGYKIQFKTNSLNENLVAVGFFHPDSKESTVGGNVWSREFREKHSVIFDYLCTVDGVILEDTGQKVRFS
jgi:hypothetical protein